MTLSFRRRTAALLVLASAGVFARPAHAGWFSRTCDALAPSQLRLDVDDLKAAVRIATAEAAPEATAAQARRYGLHLPPTFDPAKPLVVLVHGLDMEISEWTPLATLLHDDGEQVATFGYPGDGPIAADVALLADRLGVLQQTYPTLKIDLVAYSMGSLVSRGYVEGPLYQGNVDHLILLAPPNHGSSWARYQMLLKAKHQFDEYESDPQWRASWIVTEGLGEAARDLTPDSVFLQQLNTLPRRPGVRYTIIAGNHHVLRRIGAEVLDDAVATLPQRWNHITAVQDCRIVATLASMTLRSTAGNSDGPVTLRSASLPGVSDVVILPADHETLYLPDGEAPPAAWPVIRDRLHE